MWDLKTIKEINSNPKTAARLCGVRHGQPAQATLGGGPLQEARDILISALSDVGGKGNHKEDCQAVVFARKNGYLPANHPAWKFQPQCSCWVGAAAVWLKNNPTT